MARYSKVTQYAQLIHAFLALTITVFVQRWGFDIFVLFDIWVFFNHFVQRSSVALQQIPELEVFRALFFSENHMEAQFSAFWRKSWPHFFQMKWNLRFFLRALFVYDDIIIGSSFSSKTRFPNCQICESKSQREKLSLQKTRNRKVSSGELSTTWCLWCCSFPG